MTDPFVQFMELYAPSCGVEEAFHSWLVKQERQEAPYIMPDIEPFVDTSGRYIKGRRDWREYLVSTGTQELGHADLQMLTAHHAKVKDEHQKRMVQATMQAPPQAIPDKASSIEPSRTAQRVMERLHGRPMPDRPTLIKIAMEERMRK